MKLPKRKLADAVLDDQEPIFSYPMTANHGGRVTVTTTASAHGGGRYPSGVNLMLRLGDDRVYLTYEMLWKDVEQLHSMLGNALKNRRRFETAIAKAKRKSSP